MLKSHYFLLLVTGLLFSCQKAETPDHSQVEPVHQRTSLEGQVFDFSSVHLFNYPKFESSALFIGDEEDRLVAIIKLEGFFTEDTRFTNGEIKIGEKFVEIASSNHPTAYFVFESFVDELNAGITPDENALFSREGYGIVWNNGVKGHIGKPYSEVLQIVDSDGIELFDNLVPCKGQSDIQKHCKTGGCGQSSCSHGEKWSAATITSIYNCSVSCENGYWACCTDTSCTCFKEACCAERF